MSEESEKPKFRYMLEFPNKVKIYATDEQILSNILEKSGMFQAVTGSTSVVSKSKPVEKESFVQSRLILQCTDCGSTKLSYDDTHKKTVCTACGLVLDDSSKTESFDKPNIESHPGYKIRENERGFEIVRRSKNASYKTKVSRSTVDEVYRFLKKTEGQLPVSEIEKALDISNVTIYNALKVLQAHGRVHLELSNCLGRKNLSVYRAI